MTNRASPKSSEASLWKWLVRARQPLGAALHIQRVENLVAQGVPDVEGCLGGRQFWIELKCSPRPARASTSINVKFRPRQVPWLERRCGAGGRALVLLQVGSGHVASRYLVPGTLAASLDSGCPEAFIRNALSLTGPDVGPDGMLHSAVMWEPTPF